MSHASIVAAAIIAFSVMRIPRRFAPFWPVFLAAAVALAAAARVYSAVPTPKEHLGFAPGDDFQLADTAQIFGYFQKLAASSDRIRLAEFGKTSLGKPMYIAFISAPENLKRLEHYREISRRLALGQASADEARRLASEGKTVVWIDSGLHASEVAPAQQAPELAYRLITGDGPEIEAIRRDVILLQVPVINPDGLDMVAHWYRKNVGTPYETATLPWLYQKYSGHDNNRDWFMLNLAETRHVTRVLFREWFPQIVYNQHQQPPFPARIFVPPYDEPLNPNIPTAVMEGINLIGSAIKERFALENKPGVLSYLGFDSWWNGGLRSVPAFHNMHGILTETAGGILGTPRTISPADIHPRFANGIPTHEPSIFYERPWLGGRWGVREAIDYMLTVDFAILEFAAQRRPDFLFKSWRMAREAIDAGERGSPYAYVVPPTQWDKPTAIEMLDRLQQAGIEIRRAASPFNAGGSQYPEGAYVIPAAQPFRPYLVDLLEPQRYPEIRNGTSGAVKRPYDITGWTLSMQMGVAVNRIDQRFEAKTIPVASLPSPAAGTLHHRENASFLTTAELLDRGQRIRWARDGTILTGDTGAAAAWELRKPRLALYEPWIANADQGWTEWLLDRFRISYSILHNADLTNANLRDRFDTVIIAQQSAASILNGVRHGEIGRPEGSDDVPTVLVQRPEYTGGIGAAGVAAVQKFVAEGGTLITLDTASELAIQFLPLPVRNLVRPALGAEADSAASASGAFYAPGSLIRLTLDTTNPIAFGMPGEVAAMTTGGTAFDITLPEAYNQGGNRIRSIARFAEKNLLASGWVSGERTVSGKHALLEASFGRGRVVLFGFRPQFRGQTFATFKLLLNAVYLGSAQPL
jgi:hypothetical protein